LNNLFYFLFFFKKNKKNRKKKKYIGMSDFSSNSTSTTNVNNKIVYRPPALIIGDIAVEKKAIEDDIRYLLQEFIKVGIKYI